MSTRTGRLVVLLLPSVFAVAWLLTLFGETGSPIWALWRPLTVVLVFAWLVQGLSTVAARSISLGSLIATIVLAAVAAFWVLALPLLGLCAWWVAVNQARKRRHARTIARSFLEDRTRDLAVVAGIALVLVIGQGFAAGLYWNPQVDASQARARSDVPDVFVILLDGYPNAEDLRSRFGIDNDPFVTALQSRGFDVSADSHTNYSMTWLTLASLFQMGYVQDLPSLASLGAADPRQYGRLGQLVDQGAALDVLRGAGYRIVSTPSEYAEVALRNADVAYGNVGPTRLESTLIEKTLLGGIGGDIARDWLAEQHRASVMTALERIRDTAAEDVPEPTFMFAHVFSPHPPLVFNADGSGRPLPDCYPSSCGMNAPSLEQLQMTKGEYATALQAQLTYLNEQVLATVDAVSAADPGAVIILFGDHATRYDVLADPEEALMGMFAARTPGRDHLFGDAPYPAAMLPTLFNSYLGTAVDIPPYRAWVSYFDRPLNMAELH